MKFLSDFDHMKIDLRCKFQPYWFSSSFYLAIVMFVAPLVAQFILKMAFVEFGAKNFRNNPNGLMKH